MIVDIMNGDKNMLALKNYGQKNMKTCGKTLKIFNFRFRHLRSSRAKRKK